MKKAMFTLLTAIAAVAWVSANTTTPTTPLVISKATGTINIDGVGDEATWTGITAVDASLKGAAGNPNFSGKFKLTYDEKNIYVLVTVNDPTPGMDHPSHTWESDCVELFFAMDTNKHKSYQAGDWQIRKRASKPERDSIDGSSNVPSLLANPNFKVAQQDIATGYVQEWQLPIDSLVQGAKFDGQNFRFEIQLADNEDGSKRTAQRFWNSTADNQWNQTTNMGYVRMQTPIPVAVKQAIAKASSIRIKANSIEFAKMAKEVNVYSITGQLMLKARNVNAISTSALKSGVYFVVADGEKAKFVIK